MDSNRDTMGRGFYLVEVVTGSLIKKFTYDTNSDMSWSIPSDIAVVDTTDNGLIDRAYVGDMGGRLWRFDLASPDPTNWSSQIVFQSNDTAKGGRKIFYPPDVLLEPGYEIVVFGTGDRANPGKETVVNRIYSLKDRDTGAAFDESSLVDVTDDLLQDPAAPEETKANLRDDLKSGSGWYIRLVDNPGEKVLAPPLTFFGTVYVTTHTPTQEALVDPCSAQQGTGRLYALNYKTGEATHNFDPTNDAVGSEVLERGDRDLVIGGAIPSMMVVALIGGDAMGLVGVGGGIFETGLPNYRPIVRIYWRQVY
jgi:type IV pilus assembly protein PilY1